MCELRLQFFLLSNIFAIVWILLNLRVILVCLGKTHVGRLCPTPCDTCRTTLYDACRVRHCVRLSPSAPWYCMCYRILFLVNPSMLPADDKVHALCVSTWLDISVYFLLVPTVVMDQRITTNSCTPNRGQWPTLVFTKQGKSMSQFITGLSLLHRNTSELHWDFVLLDEP